MPATQEQLDSLSESQREIYNLVVQGLTPEQIERKLHKEAGIVSAQITRMRNKGIDITVAGESEAAYVPVQTRPEPIGPTSNEAVMQAASGQAKTFEDMAKAAAQVGGSFAKDVHPMALLGVTMQFVRLAGGRMSAHQLIEDVTVAFSEFCGVTPTDGETGTPLPQTDQERLAFLEEQVKLQREENEKLRNRR